MTLSFSVLVTRMLTSLSLPALPIPYCLCVSLHPTHTFVSDSFVKPALQSHWVYHLFPAGFWLYRCLTGISLLTHAHWARPTVLSVSVNVNPLLLAVQAEILASSLCIFSSHTHICKSHLRPYICAFSACKVNSVMSGSLQSYGL